MHPFFEKYKVSKIEKGGIRIIALLDVGLATHIRLDVFCVAVNSIEVKPTKKKRENHSWRRFKGIKTVKV